MLLVRIGLLMQENYRELKLFLTVLLNHTMNMFYE